MLKKLLKNPVGIAGVIVLAFGLMLGSNYDPKSYEQQNTYGIADPYQAAKIMAKNTQKEQDQQMELVMIWVSVGLGLLMLGNAAWKTSRSDEETDDNKSDPFEPIEPV